MDYEELIVKFNRMLSENEEMRKEDKNTVFIFSYGIFKFSDLLIEMQG